MCMRPGHCSPALSCLLALEVISLQNIKYITMLITYYSFAVYNIVCMHAGYTYSMLSIKIAMPRPHAHNSYQTCIAVEEAICASWLRGNL